MIQSYAPPMTPRFDKRHLSNVKAASQSVTATRIISDDIMATAISLLTDQEIQTMTREDMLDALHATAGTRQSPVKFDGIAVLDEPSLRKVMYLLRRGIRTRLNRQSAEKGFNAFFRDQI